jgi:hypothetical protein
LRPPITLRTVQCMLNSHHTASISIDRAGLHQLFCGTWDVTRACTVYTSFNQCNRTNKMHYLTSVYYDQEPLHVSSTYLLIIRRHCTCIWNNWCILCNDEQTVQLVGPSILKYYNEWSTKHLKKFLKHFISTLWSVTYLQSIFMLHINIIFRFLVTTTTFNQWLLQQTCYSALTTSYQSPPHHYRINKLTF